MEHFCTRNKVIIRLDKGDEIFTALSELFTKMFEGGPFFGTVEGIGGCDQVEVGIFDPERKSYVVHKREGMLELVSLNGNLTEKDGKPFFHLHAVFAYHDEDGNPQTLSGHLLKARIGLTAEIVVTAIDTGVSRCYDEELGIRTWDFRDHKS